MATETVKEIVKKVKEAEAPKEVKCNRCGATTVPYTWLGEQICSNCNSNDLQK